MDLFAPDPNANLLPCDGTVNYHGRILSPQETDRYFEALWSEIPWKNDVTVMFGKRIVTARKIAWFGDETYAYRYSGTTKQAHLWTPVLLELKTLVEQHSRTTFNSCLLNLYHHGEEGMGWHSDDEKSIVPHSAIASLSLGAERIFRLKHKREAAETASVLLESGSLLVMKGTTQANWLHCIPKTKKVTAPRINLTFRIMVR